MLQIAPNSMFLSILNDFFRGSSEENWMKQVTSPSVRHIYLSMYFHWLPIFIIFFPEVSTTQPESSSEEEDERPSSPGLPSDSSDSEDDQGTNCTVL